ncbi:Glucooligosaccharide oxidase [Nemania abortiva]|nr:Glucooligosaccharide oxidase [Nemania abortiva]
MPSLSNTLTLFWLAYGVAVAAIQANSGPSTDPLAIFTDPSIKWSPNTTILSEDAAGFENATYRWTIFRPPTYSVSITPGTEKDVMTAVGLASQHNIPFLGTGGRHGYSTTLGDLQGGLAIDLSKLNSVAVNKRAGTVTVGPGVRFADVFEPLFEAGYMLPTGSCSCVGMIGAAIGAGIGRFSGVGGLLSDHLLSARVVTGNGHLAMVSNTSNSDLFWGIRGAGANLGLLTSATFKLMPLINKGLFYNYDMIISADKAESYFKAVASLAASSSSALPAKLSMATVINYSSTSGGPQILANWVYAGTKAETDQAIKPILNLGPSFLNGTVMPWNTLTANAGFGLDASLCADNQINDLYGLNLKTFNVQTFSNVFKKMGDFYRSVPDARGASVTLEAFPNQGTLETPDTATAYPWRDAKYNILLQFSWQQPVSASAVNESTDFALELRDDFQATSGYNNLTVYVNYAHGDETPEQIYRADKLARLRELKNIWDPKNMFRFYNPIIVS